MAPKPIAKGWCENCGSFLVWSKSKLEVVMYERPNVPEVISQCPTCLMPIRNPISFKEATIFKGRGVNVVHSYDTEDDIQPLTKEEVEKMINNLDDILKVIIE